MKVLRRLIGYGIWICFMMLFCPFSVSDASSNANVSITSNLDYLEKGEEIEITVNIENAKTAAFHFSLYFEEEKLEYVSHLENTNVLENRVVFVWHDSSGGNHPKEGGLATFKFKAKEEGTVTFRLQGEFYSPTGQFIQTEVKDKQIQIGKENINFQGNNAFLQILRINREGITPNFDKETYEYYLTIPNDVNDLEVLAISENPNAIVEITGNTNLQEGLNLITVQVTSANQTQRNVYTIQVTKTANVELANTNLEILAIENVLLNPPFRQEETNYKIEISKDTDNLNILAVPENEQAVVDITGKDNLQEGLNLINIVVTAPNGFTKKKYQVEVYKRNLEEENKYQEEQQLQKEKLEQAYQVEELSHTTQDTQKGVEKENSEGNFNIIAAVMIGIAIFLLLLFFFKHKCKK